MASPADGAVALEKIATNPGVQNIVGTQQMMVGAAIAFIIFLILYFTIGMTGIVILALLYAGIQYMIIKAGQKIGGTVSRLEGYQAAYQATI